MSTRKLTNFSEIRSRAERRKGGSEALEAMLRPVPDLNELKAMSDDRVLSEMTKRVFCAGFVWKVIEAKWQGFEAAFHGFNPQFLAFSPDEFWEQLAGNKSIVRNEAKIRSARRNAHFICELAKEHGSAGRFLGNWPLRDQAGILEVIAKRGSRLGGLTGQYLLRFLGRDGFLLSVDVLTCLRLAGLELSQSATSKKDIVQVQNAFKEWADESGLPWTHISRICAMSVSES